MRGDAGLRRSRWQLAATVTVAAIATVACGTTVPNSALPSAQAGSSDLTGGASPNATQGGNGSTTSAGSGGLPGAAVNGSASGSNSSVANGPAAASFSATNAGSVRGPIKLGALTVQGAGAYQAKLGFKGATGDQLAMTQSVVDYINAHGGVGGRRIQLVHYDLDPTAVAEDESAAMQAACTYFTQDNRVAALASYVALAPENFYQCLANAHVPVVTPDEGVSSDFLRRFANNVYMPSGPSYTRLLNDSVDALWNAGWLTAKSTVGVVGYDTVDVHAIVDKGLTPALQRHGLKLAAGMYTATTTQSASEYNSGALSFKTKNVDRVFFAPGGEPIYFALAAEQQAYHPYYELGSLEYPSVLAANLPADQLSGSMGLGWLPYLDLPSAAWPTVTTPGIAECRKAMASANQDFSSGTTLGIAAWICDEWMFFRDVFAAGASPDEAGIRRAAESLGTSFASAATFRTSLAAGRTHDGATAYRLVAFQDGCGCYKYTSAVRSLP
jgi:hypothetical protein